MNSNEKQIIQTVANTIRVISAEGVEKAESGHPGLPMGCAEIGAYLYSFILKHNPKNPKWIGRDRFVLSAGHGSMFLYSLLHLSGYDLPLDQLKHFRQLHSHTPGHPEYGEAPGVETTTGPLGQGVAAGTGMAIAQKLLAAQFGNDLFDAKIWILAGDGCMMEGISSEASSLAGHFQLGNLVLIYDSNHICLDGPTSECFTEDTGKRYEAYGWRVLTIDGNNLDEVERSLTAARDEKSKPTLIIAHTVIGKGAPKKQGTNAAHGAMLGPEEMAAVKKNLNWPDEPFYIPQEVRGWFKKLESTYAGYESEWNKKVEAYKASNPEKAKRWDAFYGLSLPTDFAQQIWNLEVEPNKATRTQGQKILTKVAELAPFFYTGSADLSVSDNTNIKGAKIITPTDFSQRVIKFGVREFGMAAMNYGMALHGMIQPLCGTFFTFSDYMRNALRLASIMQARVYYQFTHDSIFLGEDGPTHQPIEHLAALRAMPGLSVIRPADENELKAAWIEMFQPNGPIALILTRQNIKSQGDLSRNGAREGVRRGAYILYGEKGACDVMLISTGSEVGVTMDAAKKLESQGKKVRVVSLPCWEWFEKQDAAYRESVIGGKIGLKVSIEAAATFGWHKWIGSDGLAIGIDRYGASAPAKDLAEYFGLTADKIVEKILAWRS